MVLRSGTLVKDVYGKWKWVPETSAIQSNPPPGGRKVENIYVKDGKVEVVYEDET